MKDIEDSVIQEMVSRVAAEFDPEEVILFGSRAWGEPSEESDVDLMVVVAASDVAPTQRALRARRCLRGISMPKDVLVTTREEFTRRASVRASLERKIRERGKVLYARRQG